MMQPNRPNAPTPTPAYRPHPMPIQTKPAPFRLPTSVAPWQRVPPATMAPPPVYRPQLSSTQAKPPVSGFVRALLPAPPVFRPLSLSIQKKSAVPVMQASRLPPPVPTQSNTIQQGKLNVNAHGRVTGVSKWPKRPPSNCSKQGQHLTAYVSFRDSVLSSVRLKTVPQAANGLRGLLKYYKHLPSMGRNSTASTRLKAAIRINRQLLRTAAANYDANTVGGVIDNVLAIRNQIPGTAVTTHEGGGHGEANSSGILRTAEDQFTDNGIGVLKTGWIAGTVEDQTRKMMWKLLDYDPAAPAGDPNKCDVIGERVLTHFREMQVAYPLVFAWLTGRNAYLFSYLTANRLAAGMPLRRVSTPDLLTIQNYVHTNL
jgi:hypothetical protein